MSYNSYHLYKKYIRYLFLFTLINFVKGRISQDNKILNFLNDENDFKSIFINKNNILKNEIEFINLELRQNLITLEKDKIYFLNLTNIKNKDGKELLLYTNLFDHLIYSEENVENAENDKQGSVSRFDIFSNEYINKYSNISFQSKKNSEGVKGYIDFLLVNEGEFEVNKDIEREIFYNISKTLEINKKISKYYINFIPNDNNSDAYYLQIISPHKKKLEKINLYYLNQIENDTINEVIDTLKKKQMKRDRKINGKIEIFAYEYNNLAEKIDFTLKYNRIKGEGIIGIIITLSILFCILIITVTIFLKNAYC